MLALGAKTLAYVPPVIDKFDTSNMLNKIKSVVSGDKDKDKSKTPAPPPPKDKNKEKKKQDDEDIWKGKKDERDVKDDLKIQTASDLERLHDFCRRGDKGSVEDLFKKQKGLITQAGKQGYVALHWAAFGGNTEVVDFLLDQKVDINVLNENGDTALHIAAWKGHVDVVKLLVGKGKAKQGIKNKEGKSAEDLAKGDDIAQALRGGPTKIEVAVEEPDSDDDD